MSSKLETFKALHQAGNLFVLPNAWDAKSALLLQEKNYPAIGTSSAAVADSLGYADGEGMPFADYLFVIKRILSAIKIPLTVDIEMGYGESDEAIYANIRQLVYLGVVGINIEDSIINKPGRELKDAKAFAKTIKYIKNKLTADNLNIFINVRCDTYILNVENKQQETKDRLTIYETTGADGIFLPCISTEEDIAEVVQHTKLPLNIMCIPGIPDLDTLNKLGVKRASMGPFLFNKVYNSIASLVEAINENNSFSPILC